MAELAPTRYPLRMMRCLSAAVLLLSVIAMGQAPAAVTAVETSPSFRETAANAFNGYEAKLTTHCAAVAADWTKATHTIYGTPQTGANGNLVNATWVETVPGTACGEHRRYRVLVAIRGGRASVAPLLPGDSFASPQLEADAQAPLMAAIAAFVPKGQSCPVDVLDTTLDGPTPAAGKAAWSEVWTVRACGKTLKVPIRFVPDVVGVGTSIRIESKQVTVAP